MRILTGANRNYYRELAQLLLSARRHGVLERVRAFDLGMEPEQVATLRRVFPAVDLRRFPFEDHPPHVAMEAVSYAWKPIIVAEAVEEDDGPVLWLDAATILRCDLKEVERQILQDGQYVPCTGSADWPIWIGTHPGTAEYMGVSRDEPFMEYRQRAGGVCGFDPAHPLGRRLALRWRELALEPDCITPPGSSRGNHRQDQSVLMLLLHRAVQEDGLVLTDEEIDLTSACPMDWMLTRCKLAHWWPLFLDPILWRWFWFWSRWEVHQRAHAARRAS